MRRLLAPTALAIGLTVGLAAWRGGWIVQAIRAADRRGGIASARGEEAYAGVASLFGGLHRLVAADIAATALPGDVVLDVGAGPGDLLALVGEVAPGVTRIGVEPSGTMRALAAERGIAEQDGRAEALPLPDASVDLLVSTLSAHHWDDPAAAFRQAWRVLRPGGEARIYDVRFAGYGRREAERLAAAAGIAPGAVTHSILPERLLGFRPYSRITITRSKERP